MWTVTSGGLFIEVLTTKTARIPQGERRKMQTGWPRPNVDNEIISLFTVTHHGKWK